MAIPQTTLKAQSVDFIFDEQGDIGYEAASWYSDMKATFPPVR
jgi:hypothetical protein